MQPPRGLRLWSSAPELRGHQQIKCPWALGSPRRLTGALTQPRCQASTREAEDSAVCCFERSLPTLPGSLEPSISLASQTLGGATGREEACGRRLASAPACAVGGRGLQQSPVTAPQCPHRQICNGAGCGGGRAVPVPPSAQGPRPQTEQARLLAGPARDLEQSRPRVCPAQAPGRVTGSAQSQNSRPPSWRLGPDSALLSCPWAPQPPAWSSQAPAGQPPARSRPPGRRPPDLGPM